VISQHLLIFWQNLGTSHKKIQKASLRKLTNNRHKPAQHNLCIKWRKNIPQLSHDFFVRLSVFVVGSAYGPSSPWMNWFHFNQMSGTMICCQENSATLVNPVVMICYWAYAALTVDLSVLYILILSRVICPWPDIVSLGSASNTPWKEKTTPKYCDIWLFDGI